MYNLCLKYKPSYCAGISKHKLWLSRWSAVTRRLEYFHKGFFLSGVGGSLLNLSNQGNIALSIVHVYLAGFWLKKCSILVGGGGDCV